MKEITLKVYEYSELKGKSKDYATSKIMDMFLDIFYDFENDFINHDMIPDELLNRGISIENMRSFWCCGYSQGDYLYLKGDLVLNKELLLNIGMDKAECDLILGMMPSIEIGSSNSFYDDYLKWDGFSEECNISLEYKFEENLNKYLYNLYYDLKEMIRDIYLEIGSENYIEDFLEGNDDILFMENGELIQI